MIDVEKSEIYPHLSCGEIFKFVQDTGVFFVIYTILLWIRFVAIYLLLCIKRDKFNPKFYRWGKNDKY